MVRLQTLVATERCAWAMPRTGAAATERAAPIEVGSAFVEGDADGAATGVRTDDRTDVAHDDVARVVRPQHLDELVDIAAVGVQHGEVRDGAVALQLLDEEGQCLGAGALLAALFDLAVAHL